VLPDSAAAAATPPLSPLYVVARAGGWFTLPADSGNMQLSPFISQKFRFYAFVSMLLLVYVHGYNLRDSYLQPFTLVQEPLTFTSFFEYLTANGLFRFRIPMLFAISGYLFALGDAQPHGQRVKKRLRTLLLPYLLWSGIALLLTFLLQQFPPTAQAVANAQLDQLGDNRPYTEIGLTGMLTRLTLTPIAYQLWFIRVLLVYNLAYPLIKKAVVKAPKIWFPIVTFLWLTMFGLHFIEGEGLLFFSLGAWLAINRSDLTKPPAWLSLKWTLPVFLAAAAGKTTLAFYLQHGFAGDITLLLLHKITVFTGFISIWFGADGLVRYCMSRPWFVWLSAFSFIIYALHVPLINYAHQLLLPVTNSWRLGRLADYTLLPLLIILFSILVGAALRALFPRAYALLTGGRGMS